MKELLSTSIRAEEGDRNTTAGNSEELKLLGNQNPSKNRKLVSLSSAVQTLSDTRQTPNYRGKEISFPCCLFLT